MRIDGKTALVTGGSAGIGRQIAWQLAAAGARVIIVARSAAGAAETCAADPDWISWLEADLAKPSGQVRVVAEVARRRSDLAILVNNAGVQVNLPPSGIGDGGVLDAMRAELELNLMAPMALSLGLMPILDRQLDAVCVNISSGLALAPKRTAPGYCASKAGLRAFTRGFRYRCEDAAPAVRVVDAIMPLVDTAMTEGRGAGKISAAAAARGVVAAIRDPRDEVWIGKAGLLRHLARIAPGRAFRLMRNG
ncbi:MAG: SDR family NAD(P)-dependent oxidoreductase [Pseudomonadota bacterium]